MQRSQRAFTATASRACAFALAQIALTASAAAAEISFSIGPQIVANSVPANRYLDTSGLSGIVETVRVSLDGFSHTSPSDLTFGIINVTQNKGFVFMSGVGFSEEVANLDLVFRDDASELLPRFPLASGTYKPSNYNFGRYILSDNLNSFAEFSGFQLGDTWAISLSDYLNRNDVGSVSNAMVTFVLRDADAAVPEPSTWALMVLGFGAVGCSMRCRPHARFQHAIGRS